MRYELYGEDRDRIGPVYHIVMMTEKLEFMMDYLVCCSTAEKGKYVILDHVLSKVLFYCGHELMGEQKGEDLKEIVYSCKLAKTTAANRTRRDLFPFLAQKANEETEEFLYGKAGKIV